MNKNKGSVHTKKFYLFNSYNDIFILKIMLLSPLTSNIILKH